MKKIKGFTMIEVCVVLAVIAILAVAAVLYGKNWVNQYRFSNLLHSVQGGIKMARMQAMSHGRNTILRFTDKYVDSTITPEMATSDFRGDYALVGPWPDIADTSTTDVNSRRRILYFMYNNNYYSFEDVPSVSSTETPLKLEFISRGFPIDYQEKVISFSSKYLKNNFTLKITSTGKVERKEP